jgi:hypothetical protein
VSYSIQNVNTDLEGALHGTTTNQIEGLFALYGRAARQLLLDIDPQETKRTALFASPIFNGVNYYALASDVKGNRLIDIRPQVSRTPRDVWSQKYNQEFDILKQNIFASGNMFTMNFNTGVKTILINAPFLPSPVIQNQVSAITGSGTWAVGGGASALAADNQNYVYGGGSLSFTLPSGAGYLENSTMTSTDLTTYLNQGTFFLWVYMPTGSSFTSVNLKWGSSSSAYYGVTSTTTQQGTAFQNGWNLLSFPWAGNTTVGSPTVTAINYLKVTFNTTAVQTGAHLNYITVALGNYLEYEYYSKFLFRDSTTGAFQETVTDVSNLINLDTETYNLFFNLAASLAVQQQQGLDALFYDGNFFAQKYAEGIAKYRLLYKSEVSKPATQYYAMPNKRYGRRGYNY